MSSEQDLQSIEQITRMKIACSRIFANVKDIESVNELHNLIKGAQSTIVKALEPIIFSVFVPILKSISESSGNYNEREKQTIIDTFKVFFEKINIDKLPLFFNVYGFLLFEIYDHKNNTVLNISEEYKLSIVECMSALIKCLDSSTTENLYVKENAPKLCQMIYVVIEIAKNHKFRTLRLAAIKCLMAIAHVLEDEDFEDVVLRNQIAEVFLFFLPGIATHLKTIALIDEKFGHQIPCLALKAWGRIVTLLMQDYSAFDQKINTVGSTNKSNIKTPKTRWKDENELKEYIQNTNRSPEWYKETDNKLKQFIIEFSKLAHHSHPKVRLELVTLSCLLIENCTNTMPVSITHLVDLIIISSEDEDELISNKSRSLLDNLSNKLTNKEFKFLLDNLEENFYNIVNGIPRKFNGIDEKAQIVALNSLIGYITLFGKHGLTQILYSPVHLNRLVLTLIHISEFEKSNISILEEYATPDYDLNEDFKMSWKHFRHFKENSVCLKIETICHLLAKHGASQIISDFLLDLFSNSEHRKEATFLLNEIATGIEPDNNLNIFKNIVSMYIDSTNWYLPLSVMIDEYGYEVTLGDAQNNIILVCLLVEGLGKIALVLKQDYQHFLLKTLYLILERAGSAHPVIRSAGLLSLTNICQACGYATITDLINKNIDYFSFHIERKLRKIKESYGGLNVLAVIIKYSTQEVLNSTCEIIRELLFRTSNKNLTNLNSHLYVFKMFIVSLHKWLNLKIEPDKFKTKKQKQEEIEDFEVSNIEKIDNFSDEIMGKTAEEMYKEDMEKSQQEIDEEIEPYESEYKKPKPPIHIQLTVEILTQTLHYLPSKNQSRKILILDILKTGLPILKEWEDELLPIVHQIWSPLVDRFKEDDPLVINFSFQLLVVLATLSKEFIRSRTSKDVLPSILTVLDKLVHESYLKDKGSAYRYSQNYKLQITILENLANIVTDLDMLQQDLDKCCQVVFQYISDKQPIALQDLSLKFFKILITYDQNSIEEKIKVLSSNAIPELEKNSTILLGYLNK